MRRLISLLFVLCLVAAACGGRDGGQASTTTADVETTSDESSPPTSTNDGDNADDGVSSDLDEADQPASVTDDDGADNARDETPDEPALEDDGPATELSASVADEDSPLSALLGFDGFDDPAFLVEQQRRVDEQIQRCMRAEGFEYLPQDLNPEDFAFGRSLAPGLSDEEFAKQYGYGVAATADTLIRLTNQGIDNPTNQMLLEMSDAEEAAWQRAMLGADVDIDRETGAFTDPETGEPIDVTQLMMTSDGCASTANREVFSSLQALFVLESEFADLNARFNSDQRVTEITAGWASCLAESGFSYARLDEPVTQFNNRLNALINPLLAAAMSASGDGPPEPIALDAEQQAEVDALQAEEIAVAIADYACLAGDLDELDEIQRRYELAFIDENADALGAAAG